MSAHVSATTKPVPASLLVALLGISSGQIATAATVADQYLCPNGSIAQVSYNEDQSSMRLRIKGRLHTLQRNDKNTGYGGGKYTATMDDGMLHLVIAGSLLPQHCRLQISASPATSSPKQ